MGVRETNTESLAREIPSFSAALTDFDVCCVSHRVTVATNVHLFHALGYDMLGRCLSPFILNLSI